MFNKGITSALLALVIIVTVSIWFNMRGPDIAPYQHLKNPGVRFMQPRRVLVVEAKGTPETVGKKAFGLLFKTYYGLKKVPRKKNIPAPRARWPLPASTPQTEWVGRYAMPVPDSIKDVPLPRAHGGLTLQLTTWEYGDVAEILYTGPYDKETPAINRLHEFIKSSGYEIIGEHEEEYLKGPGMLFRGNPKNYMTIIRYRIRKTESRHENQ
jgi:hypothetical protein